MVTQRRGAPPGRSRGRSSSRRKTQWQDTLISVTLVEAAQAGITLLGDLASVDTQGMTLTRLLIRLTVQQVVSTVGTANETSLYDMGIGVIEQDAFAAAVFPDPVSQDDSTPRGWVYRVRLALTDVAAVPSWDPQFIQEDLKGQRTIGNGELVLIHNNNASIGDGFTMHINGIVRCLFLLP